MNKTLVELQDVSFGYGFGKQRSIIASGITFTLSAGEFVLLLGPNGCGKSTIIRGMFDLVDRFSGTVKWHIPRYEVGYIPQEAAIDHDIPATALDVVCTAQPDTWGKNLSAGTETLELVGMRKHCNRRFGTLSGGQKRRVLLARALYGNPKLLVLDEPTVNTDRETEQKIETILLTLCKEKGVGILATTHSETWAKEAKRFHMSGGTAHA